MSIGTTSHHLDTDIKTAIPHATTFISGLDWLRGHPDDDEVAIGRMLLVDRLNILVSTSPDGEHAIFGRGFHNGLVVIARRLMAQGFLGEQAPEIDYR